MEILVLVDDEATKEDYRTRLFYLSQSEENISFGTIIVQQPFDNSC
jgi:hypothetical protein